MQPMVPIWKSVPALFVATAQKLKHSALPTTQCEGMMSKLLPFWNSMQCLEVSAQHGKNVFCDSCHMSYELIDVYVYK